MHINRFRIVLVILSLAFLGLTVRAAVLTLGSANQENSDLAIMTRNPHSLAQLSDHATKLEAMTHNIEEYSFGKIRRAINDTIGLIKRTNREIEAQYKAWLGVKGNIDEDAEYYNKLQEQLIQVQKMQNAEIIRLQALLGEVNKPSLYSSAVEIIITFILGVLSSWAATFFWLKWRKRANREKTI